MVGVSVYAAGRPVVGDCAQAFMPYSNGTPLEDVNALFRRLGGIGLGLNVLLQETPAMGKLFGAINTLIMVTGMADVNRASCNKMCALGCDVLSTLDHAGRKGAHVGGDMLEALASCFEDINALVDGFSQDGWLLRMACNERMKEEFDTLHEAVIEMLKGGGLPDMPDGRALPSASYRDTVKPLRRMLKQLGRGSVTAGLQSLRESEVSLEEVARLLEVQPELLAKAVAQVPESGLDLDVLYHNLMQCNGQLRQLLDNQRCSITPEVSRYSMGGVDADHSSAQAGLYADLFNWYDKNKSGAIEQEELQAVLADLGMLEGKSAGEVSLFTANNMRVADAQAAQQGLGLSRDAFCRLYDTLVMNKARQQLRFRLGLQAEEDLKAAFTSFASFGSRELVAEMDGAHFQKLCRDCELLGKHLDTTDVDIIFAKVKTKGARKITFEQFVTAISKLADKKVMSFEELVTQVLEAGGPIAHATKADAVRLHDDKSSYTGVYARGGPSNVEPVFDLSQYLDRSTPADVRGVMKTTTPKSGKKVMLTEGSTATPDRAAASITCRGTPGIAVPSTPASARRAATGGLPSSSDHEFISTADVIPSAGQDTPVEGRRGHVVAAAPPASPTQTGCMSVNRRRSTTGDIQPPVRTSSLTDVLKEALAGLRKDKTPTPPRSGRKAVKPETPQKTPASAGKIGALRDINRGEPADLQDVYNAFAGFGIHTTPSKNTEPIFFTSTATPTTVSCRRLSTPGNASGSKQPAEMDGLRFAKLCREAGIVDHNYGTTSVDIVFAKTKTKGAKKINFRQFTQALALIAAEKGVGVGEVIVAIQHCGGPALKASTPDAVRRSITLAAGCNS